MSEEDMSKTIIQEEKPIEQHKPNRLVNIIGVSAIVAVSAFGGYSYAKHNIEGLTQKDGATYVQVEGTELPLSKKGEQFYLGTPDYALQTLNQIALDEARTKSQLEFYLNQTHEIDEGLVQKFSAAAMTSAKFNPELGNALYALGIQTLDMEHVDYATKQVVIDIYEKIAAEDPSITDSLPDDARRRITSVKFDKIKGLVNGLIEEVKGYIDPTLVQQVREELAETGKQIKDYSEKNLTRDNLQGAYEDFKERFGR